MCGFTIHLWKKILGYAFFKTSRKAKENKSCNEIEWKTRFYPPKVQISFGPLFAIVSIKCSWLAMSQQAMDNWDHQHLEDLGG